LKVFGLGIRDYLGLHLLGGTDTARGGRRNGQTFKFTQQRPERNPDWLKKE
jgi:hypothetical protein